MNRFSKGGGVVVRRGTAGVGPQGRTRFGWSKPTTCRRSGPAEMKNPGYDSRTTACSRCFNCATSFLVRGVDFGVGERPLRVAVGEGVGHALLARRARSCRGTRRRVRPPSRFAGLACLTTCRIGFVRCRLGQDHRHVAADGREGRQRPEGLAGVPARQQQVQIQLGQQHGVAQIVLPGQRRQQLAEFAKLEFAEVNGGGFQEERGAVRAAHVVQPAQAELLQEFLEQALQVVDVELAPRGRRRSRRAELRWPVRAMATRRSSRRWPLVSVKTRPTSNRATS